MHNIRWKLYKTLCRIAFWLCPQPERLVLGAIWEEKFDAFRREVEMRKIVEEEAWVETKKVKSRGVAMPDTSEVVAAADAMREKRRELIAQPLDRIWVQLARSAIEAVECVRLDRATLTGYRSGAKGMRAPCRVVYTIDGRRGRCDEFLQDGDAFVVFDGGSSETVKWNHLEPEPTE